MRLSEIKEGEEEREEAGRGASDRHTTWPVSPFNVIWCMMLCASFGVEFLLSG